MLKTIRLKNFKLHEDTKIDAAPITVFIGPNNSGKSSIFQALLLLKQAAARNDTFLCQPPAGIQPPPPEHYLYSPSLIVDVGAFEEVARKGANEIEVQLCGDVKAQRPVQSINDASADLTLRIKDNRLVSNQGSISFGPSQAKWEFIEGIPNQASNASLRLGGVNYILRISNTFQLIQPGGIEADPQLPHNKRLTYNEFAQWLGAIPMNLMASLHPVYALRGFEEWTYPISDFPPRSLELMTLHDRALALPNALAADRQLKGKLSARLEELLQISIDFEVGFGKRLKVWAKSSATNPRETLFLNEGSGANQLPFIFVPVLLTPSNETVLLSEPEAHLHPKAQCDLTRMLLTVAKKENIQFFIETHSEHVLHVILNAVAKGEWTHDQVALNYFQNKNGVADVRRRDINQFGQVDGGLPDFFEQNLAELTEYLKALSKS
jgi:energy-coupling factor transporter ATP-binding protein EcfA2